MELDEEYSSTANHVFHFSFEVLVAESESRDSRSDTLESLACFAEKRLIAA